MRVVGNRGSRSPRSIYKLDVGNMCWRWPQAPLDGVKRVALSVDRVAWQFGDEAAHAVARPKSAAAGEIEIHIDSCKGPLLATLPLAPAATGKTELIADVSTPPNTGVRDVCVIASGDPRDGQWALTRIRFSRGDAR
jgi:hexosaminidase